MTLAGQVPPAINSRVQTIATVVVSVLTASVFVRACGRAQIALFTISRRTILTFADRGSNHRTVMK